MEVKLGIGNKGLRREEWEDTLHRRSRVILKGSRCLETTTNPPWPTGELTRAGRSVRLRQAGGLGKHVARTRITGALVVMHCARGKLEFCSSQRHRGRDGHQQLLPDFSAQTEPGSREDAVDRDASPSLCDANQPARGTPPCESSALAASGGDRRGGACVGALAEARRRVELLLLRRSPGSTRRGVASS